MEIQNGRLVFIKDGIWIGGRIGRSEWWRRRQRGPRNDDKRMNGIFFVYSIAQASIFYCHAHTHTAQTHCTGINHPVTQLIFCHLIPFWTAHTILSICRSFIPHFLVAMHTQHIVQHKVKLVRARERESETKHCRKWHFQHPYFTPFV